MSVVLIGESSVDNTQLLPLFAQSISRDVIMFLFQTFPFFGVVPVILDEEGREITEPNKEGYLVSV